MPAVKCSSKGTIFHSEDHFLQHSSLMLYQFHIVPPMAKGHGRLSVYYATKNLVQRLSLADEQMHLVFPEAKRGALSTLSKARHRPLCNTPGPLCFFSLFLPSTKGSKYKASEPLATSPLEIQSPTPIVFPRAFPIVKSFCSCRHFAIGQDARNGHGARSYDGSVLDHAYPLQKCPCHSHLAPS